MTKKDYLEGLEVAWGIIANAYGGAWGKADPWWQDAAVQWRDKVWHKALDDRSLTTMDYILNYYKTKR